MIKVITYGTFDLFHKGHLEILRRARGLGDHLTVVVSTNEFNDLKGKKCSYSYEDRSSIVEAIKYVDTVLPETSWNQKFDDIKSNNIDILVMGDDWEGKFDYLSDICKVVYLPRTAGVSTTLTKERLKSL
tara:strand:+ start:3337 stop:3726 length:390 start_codon:yes stop_codon:yes gene_type:complete